MKGKSRGHAVRLGPCCHVGERTWEDGLENLREAQYAWLCKSALCVLVAEHLQPSLPCSLP